MSVRARLKITKPGCRAAWQLPARCLFLAAALLSAQAAAVPIPFKNCGKAGDVLSMQQYDSSVWPPSVAAPFNATATLDTSGQITNLSVFLLLGPEWVFDTGPLQTSASGGFVSLPASMPVTVNSPPLPVKAGPYVIVRTFTREGASTTIASKGTVGKDVVPLTTTLSLSFNGTPGFPLKPQIGVYSLHVQMTEASGQEVFCFDLNMPLKTAVPAVRVAATPSIPVLSPTALGMLFLLIAGIGLFVVRVRRQ
jgi:hypothetical protein